MGKILARYRQQPGERIDYRIDYTCWAVRSQELVSATLDVVRLIPDDQTVNLVTSGPFILDTENLSWVATGGLDQEEYQITIRATMNNGEIVEADMTLTVEEV